MGIALYAVTIFLSAFLLFQVQPLIARMILPWFGGSAAVWTTCMLFFQIVLLLGYLYVWWGVKNLTPRRHSYLHMGLLGLSLLVLPITPGPEWKPVGGANPSLGILLLLGACVGFPYFLLSTTSPLLQSWYSRTGKGALPYRLFALSNLGSMLALLSYPALVEPFLPSRQQGMLWSMAYAGFVALCGLTAWKSGSGVVEAIPEPEPASDAVEAIPEEPPGMGKLAMWVALAACPSALLLSVTNHLTADVASIPFLWIVPLTLYLITFILCFDADGWYRRPFYYALLPAALGGMSYVLYTGTEDHKLAILLAIFCSGFFICCMFCHGELVKQKPHPKYLTSFYLMLSVGGAVGGLFVGLLAPYVFPSYFEFPITLIFTGFLAVMVLVGDPTSRFYEGWTSWVIILLMAGVLGLCVFNGRIIRNTVGEYKIVKRNFYGSLRVRENGSAGELDQYRTLLHGAINHGEEWLHPTKRRDPLTYYCPATGVGVAIRTRELGVQQRVGVFGLGAGTVAGYARPGDYYRFYEINPMVVQLARQEFFYLPEAPGEVSVALGDARLALERDPIQNFDVLAVDCFSGDSIPVHLLTKEAIELYFRHLKPNGILAMHTSNRYLDLEPVLEKVATTLGKTTLQVETEEDDEKSCFGSTWVLIASKEALRHKVFEGAGEAVKPRAGLRLWTDDYSSLLSVVRR